MQSQIILNGIPTNEYWDQVRNIVQECIAQMPTTDTSKPFLTLTDACEFTGLSKSTLYRMTSEKAIPHIKRGGKLLFNREELTAWLNQAKQPVIE